MRILTIINDLSAGGRQRAAQDYTLGYADAGHDAAVLALEGGGPRAEVLREREVPLFIGGGDTARHAAVEEAAAWAPHVLHLHSVGPVRPYEAQAVEALKRRLPASTKVLETTSFGKVDYRQRYALTDVHLLLARWAMWRWQQWTEPLHPAPLGVLVPNVVNPEAFYPEPAQVGATFREAHGIPLDAFVFGCVARPDPVKWPPITFEAFADVARADPRVYYVVAGLTAEARARVDALPPDVRRRVVELPFQRGDDALRRCYNAFDVFLHASSIGESFGIVFIEALLCGTPVITVSTPSRNNSQLEVVGHERGGLIVNDRASMATAMRRLVADDALRERLARDGAAYTRAHYTLDQVVPTLLHIIDHARAAPSREALRHTLVEDPDLVTHVPDSEIDALLHRTLGSPSLRERVLMRLIHTPLLARGWWGLQRLRARNRRAGRPPHASTAPDSGVSRGAS